MNGRVDQLNYIHIYLLNYIHIYLLNYIHIYLIIYIFTYLIIYIFTYLIIYIFTYFLVDSTSERPTTNSRFVDITRKGSIQCPKLTKPYSFNYLIYLLIDYS